MDWITTGLFGAVGIFGLWMAFPTPKAGESRWLLLGRWLLFVVLLGIGLLLVLFFLAQLAQAPR